MRDVLLDELFELLPAEALDYAAAAVLGVSTLVLAVFSLFTDGAL